MKKLLFLALWSAIPSGGIIPVGSRVMRAKDGRQKRRAGFIEEAAL